MSSGQGNKAGLLKRDSSGLSLPGVADALKTAKAVCVMDRADSFGGFGPMYMEIASALMMNSRKPALMNKIYGLGGRIFSLSTQNWF